MGIWLAVGNVRRKIQSETLVEDICLRGIEFEIRNRSMQVIVATLGIVVGSRRRSRNAAGIGLLVIDCCKCLGCCSVRINERAFPAEVGSHPNGRVGWLVGFDNDFGPLSHLLRALVERLALVQKVKAQPQSHSVNRIRYDRYEVVRDDCYIMLIDSKSYHCFSAGVNKTKSICFAFDEFKFGQPSVCSTCRLCQTDLYRHRTIDHVRAVEYSQLATFLQCEFILPLIKVVFAVGGSPGPLRAYLTMSSYFL